MFFLLVKRKEVPNQNGSLNLKLWETICSSTVISIFIKTIFDQEGYQCSTTIFLIYLLIFNIFVLSKMLQRCLVTAAIIPWHPNKKCWNVLDSAIRLTKTLPPKTRCFDMDWYWPDIRRTSWKWFVEHDEYWLSHQTALLSN